MGEGGATYRKYIMLTFKMNEGTVDVCLSKKCVCGSQLVLPIPFSHSILCNTHVCTGSFSTPVYIVIEAYS